MKHFRQIGVDRIVGRRRGKDLVRFVAVLLIILLASTVVAPATALADTRSTRHIHCSLMPAWGSLWSGYYYTRAAKVDVYGPSGYYRHWARNSWAGAFNNPTTVFEGCPSGSYRIRCRWYTNSGQLIREDNKYITVSSNHNLVWFRSPN